MFLDQVGTLLSYHDRRGVRVSTWYLWHYGGVNNSQVLDPVYTKMRVYYSIRIVVRTHLARSHRMIDSGCVENSQTSPVIITGELVLGTLRHGVVHK